MTNRNIKHYILLPDNSYADLDDSMIVTLDHDVIGMDDASVSATMSKVATWMDAKLDADEAGEPAPEDKPAEGVVAIGQVGVTVASRVPTSDSLH